MKPILKYSLIGVAVVALVLGVGKCYSGRADAWEARVVTTLAESKRLRARVVDLQAEAEELRSQAVASAEEAEAREPVIRERIEALPPAVTPGEVERDEIIVELERNRDRWKLAYELSDMANGRLQQAIGVAVTRGDSLESVLEDRPGKHPWFIPEVGIGPFAGLCADGRACIGPVSINLSWKLKL